MPRAVKFDHYGELDVLKVVEVPRPVPSAGQVLVRVKAAGINPGESTIRRGQLDKIWPATFPSGQGSDFAGVVEEVGEGVSTFAAGDEVIGYSNSRSSHAEYVAVDAGQLIPRPSQVPWEVAGALKVAATSAYASVRAVGLKAGDTVAVSGASGGVGSMAVQLAKRTGAKVIGIASESRFDWLRAHGIIPVAYGEGLAERLKEAAGGPLDAMIDTYGGDYVKLAIDLGVRPQRINSIINFAAAQQYGTKAEGNADVNSTEVLAELAPLIAKGELEVPIAHTYSLEQVQDAYRELEKRHTLGKIVLIP